MFCRTFRSDAYRRGWHLIIPRVPIYSASSRIKDLVHLVSCKMLFYEPFAGIRYQTIFHYIMKFLHKQTLSNKILGTRRSCFLPVLESANAQQTTGLGQYFGVDVCVCRGECDGAASGRTFTRAAEDRECRYAKAGRSGPQRAYDRGERVSDSLHLTNSPLALNWIGSGRL